MVLNITLTADKTILSKSEVETTGETVVFNIMVKNNSTSEITDLVLTSNNDELNELLKSVTKTLVANETYSFKKSISVTNIADKVFTVYVRGVNSDWVQEPDFDYPDGINPVYKLGFDNSIYSTVNLAVYNFNVILSVVRIPGVKYGDVESYVSEDEFRNKYLKFRLVIENKSVDDNNNFLPLYNFVITDVIKSSEIVQEDCVLTVNEESIASPSHVQFNIANELNPTHNEDYSIQLSSCLDGKVIDAITVAFQARRKETNYITITPDGTFISNVQEVIVTTTQDETETFDFEVETKYSVGFWNSLNTLKNTSGFKDTFHLDALSEGDESFFDDIRREADLETRRKVSVYHDKTELVGVIDGVNKVFCLQEGLLFDGFNFNSKVDREDIIVYKIDNGVYCEVKDRIRNGIKGAVCCDNCPTYEKVCVSCINEFGNIVLEEAPTIEYTIVADYWSFDGEFIDFDEIKTISTNILATKIMRKIKDELGHYIETEGGARRYFGVSQKDYKNDADRLVESITRTPLGGKVFKNV